MISFKRMGLLSLAILSAAQVWAATENPIFIQFGTPWKKFDKQSFPGMTWATTSFNDASWPTISTPEYIFNEEEEEEMERRGIYNLTEEQEEKAFFSSYYRRSIRIQDPSIYSSISVRVRFDQGVIVYVNGQEVYRNNMPDGRVGYRSSALTDGIIQAMMIKQFSLSPSLFKVGENIVSVEIHKHRSKNIRNNFDMQMAGNKSSAAATLTRGPYLQVNTGTSIVVHWQTQAPSDARVSFGTSPDALTQHVDNPTATNTDHIIKLTGLTPNTKYYYSIGTTTDLLQGDAQNYFVTAPLEGSTQKINIWALGDFGVGLTNANQIGVRDGYKAYMGDKHTDVWITMGDNAYVSGLDQEFQTNVFDVYDPFQFKHIVFAPAPGNHDYNNNPVQQTFHEFCPFYTIFSMPINGEAGGVASGHKEYYSFNYGNVHFVAIDAYGLEANKRLADSTSAQAQWIKQDLEANTMPWTILYWHHPPYTKGSHNSDTEGELVDIRADFLPFLEQFKIDLVLTGHSHSYERSFPMLGHYGLEPSYDPAFAKSTSSGKYPESAPYIKSSANNDQGIVYIVAGSGGQLGGQTSGYPHNAMYYSNVDTGGSLSIEVEDTRMDVKWVTTDGTVHDNFTIFKDVNVNKYHEVLRGFSKTITASWVGEYNWSNGAKTRSIEVTPLTQTVYTVNDGKGYLQDTHTVNPVDVLAVEANNMPGYELNIFPNPSVDGRIAIRSAGEEGSTAVLTIVDLAGREVFRMDNYQISKEQVVELKTAGMYLVSIQNDKGMLTQKVQVK